MDYAINFPLDNSILLHSILIIFFRVAQVLNYQVQISKTLTIFLSFESYSLPKDVTVIVKGRREDSNSIRGAITTAIKQYQSKSKLDRHLIFHLAMAHSTSRYAKSLRWIHDMLSNCYELSSLTESQRSYL